MPTLPHLIPPFRYALVEECLFRGGYPKPRNLRFMKRLRLKTILSLVPEPLIPELQDFCRQSNINVVHLKVDRMKEDNIPLSYNKTLLALQIMINPANHPLYVHCLDGADVTGLVIACLRKLQMWSTPSVVAEFTRNLHTHVITSEEFEFIENFKNFEVVIPSTIPSWLWGGEVGFRKHHSLRLKFLNPDMMTEEEREIKHLKERREKEKEDYYKRRKNDLLDNLLETAPNNNSLRLSHRQGDQRDDMGLPIFHRTDKINSDDEYEAQVEECESPASVAKGPVSATDGSFGDTMNPRRASAYFGLYNGVASPPLFSSQGQPNKADVDLLDGKGTNNSNNGGPSRSRDKYLVNVDVDVNGVMMDGLDQVEYYSSRTSNEDRGSLRFYDSPDPEEEQLEGERDKVKSGSSSRRYSMAEPLSRILDALALEGVNER